jgi:GTP-binding protein HflX
MLDASEPTHLMEKKLSICLETIERIGAAGVPIITVLNKIDLIPEAEIHQKLRTMKEKATSLVPISALYGTNLEQLKREVVKTLGNYVRASFTIPLTKETMPFIAWLYRSADVQETDYTESSVHVVFEANPSFAEEVRNRVEREFHAKVEKA